MQKTFITNQHHQQQHIVNKLNETNMNHHNHHYLINILLLLHLLSFTNIVTSDDTIPIPPNKAQVNAWFHSNVRPLKQRKGLDPALAKAESKVSHIRVSPKGGRFKTINEAIKSVPPGNKRRVVISLAGGVYKERVKIDRNKPFITFLGDPKNRPTIVFDETAAKVGTIYSATVFVWSDYFTAINVNFKNSARRPNGKKGQQAVALTISGDKAAFYRCRFLGFQDTLCDNYNRHFYKDCYIEGTVDFVFGDAKSLFVNCEFRVIEGDNFAVIAASGRRASKDQTGFSFAHCTVTGKAKGVAYLGRGWFPFSRVIVSYTKISAAINPKGWLGMRGHPQDGGTVYFGEYKNTGPGANIKSRPKYVKRLSYAQIKPYITLGYIEASKWLLPP